MFAFIVIQRFIYLVRFNIQVNANTALNTAIQVRCLKHSHFSIKRNNIEVSSGIYLIMALWLLNTEFTENPFIISNIINLW